jgi:hypothetical protein
MSVLQRRRKENRQNFFHHKATSANQSWCRYCTGTPSSFWGTTPRFRVPPNSTVQLSLRFLDGTTVPPLSTVKRQNQVSLLTRLNRIFSSRPQMRSGCRLYWNPLKLLGYNASVLCPSAFNGTTVPPFFRRYNCPSVFNGTTPGPSVPPY